MTAGEIAERFEMSKPSLSKHLGVLENAGLAESEKQGQFVHYRQIQDNLANILNGFVQEICPVARSLKKESKATAKKKASR